MKFITSSNLEQALSLFYNKANQLFATKTELSSGLSGKANSSHGTHVTWATNAPSANGTAAVGTVNRVAREDHVHPLQTTVSGNAGSANKVNNNLTIQFNSGTTDGTNKFVFNGSAAKTINITPAGIGASATGHTHDDRYYTESEINTKVSTLNTAISTAQTNATNAAKSYTDTAIANLVDSAPDAMNTLNELASAINDHQDVYDAYVEEMTTALAGKADSSHGNHVPATQTASNKVFLRNDNTWATVTPANIGAAAASHGTHVGDALSSASPKANGTAAAGTSSKIAREDHVHPLQTTVSGNAGTATKFASAQSVALTGDVTGSASSQAGWSVATTLSNSGVTAGSYGPSADASPAHKGTFTVPYITVDAKGRITSASTKTITLPADNNTTYTNEKLGNGYGTCETAEATAAKVVTLSSYTLVKNGVVSVKFTYAVPASATMNINSKGAKNIFYKGAAITAGIIKAGDIATFMYDGTQYHLLAIDRWQDNINESIKGLAISGKTITYTKGDGTTGTLTTQDTTYTHPNEGANTGSFGNSANQTPAYGATFNVPYITVNAKGHVTAISNKTVKIPASDNTWRGIQDNLTSDSTTDSLSAAQGKALKTLVDSKSDSGHTHNYAGSSSAGGAATSANKVNKNLVIKLNSGTTEGTDLFTFNGSAAKTIDLQCATEEEITTMIDTIWA